MKTVKCRLFLSVNPKFNSLELINKKGTVWDVEVEKDKTSLKYFYGYTDIDIKILGGVNHPRYRNMYLHIYDVGCLV